MTDTVRIQQNRHLAIATPLGDDKAILMSMYGTEALGRLFEYELDLLSEGQPIDPDKILCKAVTIRLDMLGGKTRYFNGIISRISLVAVDDTHEDRRLFTYRATMVPWVWFLTRQADCRIFQEKTVPDILKTFFTESTEYQLNGTYTKKEYCVQYRETDFNFVSRLMENEGIYYYFKHEDGKHTLVVCDAASFHKAVSDYEKLVFHEPASGADVGDAFIWDWSISQEITPTKLSLTDFNPLQPKDVLFKSQDVTHSHDPGPFEIFDYPGVYVTADEGRNYVRARLEEAESDYIIAHASSSGRGIYAGAIFSLADHPVCAVEDYLITAIQYQIRNDSLGLARGSAGDLFRCEITCIPNKNEFRPARSTPKPFVQGPQTALIVGKAGEEIWTDQYGRVKVKFHWDRDPAKDETSSCWIRVSQNWAGKKWGGMFLPRIGQEVIVDFLEGDPDRPIITGRVYNGDHMPPYALPTNQTVSTVKSDSSQGHGGFNELRFEDKKGSEQLFINAQLRMDERVGASLYETIGTNRENHICKDYNLLVDNEQNTHIKVKRYDKIDDIYYQHAVADVMMKYDSNLFLNVATSIQMSSPKIYFEASGQYQLGADQIFFTGGTSLELKTGQLKLQGTQSADLKTGQLKLTGDSMIDVKGGTVNVEGSTVSIKGNMAVNVEGSMSVSLKCGGNAVVIDPSGVSIQGTIVKINMGAAGAAASSAASAATPNEAQHVSQFDVTDPVDAYDATSALPGSGGGWGPGPGRTHTVIHVTPQPFPSPPPPPNQPSQPSGSSGGPGTQNQDIELVELVEVVHRTGGDTNESPAARKQFINMDAAAGHPEFTRIIHLKARIRWRSGDQTRSLAGKSVHWYFQAGGSNRASLTPASLKAGYNSDGGAEHTDTNTDSDGWTSIVDYHTSQYGGDEFTCFATLDPGYTGGLQAGAYTVWRRLFYEVDCMNRVDSGTFSNVVNENGFKGEFGRNFVEIVKVGRDSTPAYQRILMSNNVRAFAAAVQDQSMAPRYFHLIYVDTIAQTFEQAVPAGSSNQMVTVALNNPGVAGDNKIHLPATTYCLDASNWFRSCTWTQGASSGTLAQAKCTLVERPSYAVASTAADGSDGDGWDVSVDLTGVGDPTAAINVTLNFKSMDELSGLNTGIETTVGLRFRETRYGRASANSIASTQRTSTHEPGHAMGMVATKLPDGNAHPNVITTQGTHCTYNTDQCCMFRAATNFVVIFCPNCSDALRGRKLVSIPLQGTAGYT